MLTIFDFGELSFWLKYMGYIPWSKSYNHPLNRWLLIIHCAAATYQLIMRFLAARVDYTLADGSFANNMFMNLAVVGASFGHVLLLRCSRGKGGTYKAEVDEIVDKGVKRRDSTSAPPGQDAAAALLATTANDSASQTKKAKKALTGVEHTNMLLSFVEERVGKEEILNHFNASFKWYLICYRIMLFLWLLINALLSYNLLSGKKPVYERTGSNGLNYVLQMGSNIIGCFQR